MKKTLFLLLSLLLVVGSANDAFAKRKKKKSITRKEVALNIPLSDPQYQTNDDFWRAVQSGTSTDFAMAQKIAEQNCRQNLAATVQAEIKSVVENYCRNITVGERNEVESMYEELTRTVVDQQLNGITQVGQEAFRQEDGKIRFHVCLQISKRDMEQKIIEKLTEEENMRLQFDKERFKKTFNEELAKYAAEQEKALSEMEK